MRQRQTLLLWAAQVSNLGIALSVFIHRVLTVCQELGAHPGTGQKVSAITILTVWVEDTQIQ